jgi:hypothetical protein
MGRVKVTDDEEVAVKRTSQHQARTLGVRTEDHVPDHVEPRVRTRQRKATVNENPFDLPMDEIPEGSNYEWKRWSISGQHDPFYIASQRQQGWEPVNPKMHPTWVPPGYNEPHIIKDGMILMERPMELTIEARKELRQMSQVQVKEAEQRLGMTPKDTATRELSEVAPRISKEYMRAVVIED